MLTLQTKAKKMSEVTVATKPVGGAWRTPAPPVGTTGVAMTDLRPVGTCRFGDGRYECLADRGMIESGSEVEVVAVDGMQVKVRTSSG
jgi:membrane-bound ClpP family serine protease